ncbi:MAG: leucine-rich repeat domain-containing protein [Ruminococcus sp.]|nr:leucine-rich repeat domain-containing protein [Ruminococcus sp.]
MSMQDFEIENGMLKKYIGSGGAVIIPDGVTNIGMEAFRECDTVTSVIIPEGVKRIGEKAFFDCRNLVSVIIPDSVTHIENFGFSGCKSLSSVTIPDSVTQIGAYAFSRCAKLKHAPLMRVEGKLLYEPMKNHIRCKELRWLVLEKRYSVKMYPAVKYHLIFQMFLAGIDEDRTFAYIKNQFFKMFYALTDMEEIEMIQKILDTELFVTKRNIDRLIQYAIEQEKYEIQLILTDYKYQHFGFQNPADKLKL